MGDSFSKKRPGDDFDFPAEVYNAMLDTIRAVRSMQRSSSSGNLTERLDSDMVLVQNETGEACERFGVLGIDAPIFTRDESQATFEGQIAFKGVVPTEADHSGKFVILAEPIPSGEDGSAKIGRAWVSGCCIVKIDVQSEDDGFADVKDGDATQLLSGSSGTVQILWKESGTGAKWAIVRFGSGASGGLKRAITQEDIGSGGGEVKITDFTDGAWSEREETTQAYPGFPLGATPISDGKVVWMTREGGRWWIISAECEGE